MVSTEEDRREKNETLAQSIITLPLPCVPTLPNELAEESSSTEHKSEKEKVQNLKKGSCDPCCCGILIGLGIFFLCDVYFNREICFFS